MSPTEEATSDVSASSSACTRRARATTSSPASVSTPDERSTSGVPSSRSSRATWVDTFDCTVCRARAAAEKLRWSATAVRTASCRRSIAVDDDTYHQQLVVRYLPIRHDESTTKTPRTKPVPPSGSLERRSKWFPHHVD